VSSSAAAAIRAVTAAAGLHPASISDEANVPEVPNVADESTASARPVPLVAGRAGRVLAIVTCDSL
jgi:hypothetical protein